MGFLEQNHVPSGKTAHHDGPLGGGPSGVGREASAPREVPLLLSDQGAVAISSWTMVRIAAMPGYLWLQVYFDYFFCMREFCTDTNALVKILAEMPGSSGDLFHLHCGNWAVLSTVAR